MARQLQCPNCGGSHTLINPGISMLVCEYCQATVYWSEDQALHLGNQSILPEGDTRLFMGATGKLLGKPYEVVGHVRLEVERAYWDEWYLQIGGKKSAWVSESGRQLSLSRPLKLQERVPAPAKMQVGFRIKLSGHVFSVREIGEATCVGGRGQLPFTLLPGERYPYMDIATLDGKHVGTLEYDEEDEPRAYLGQSLHHEQLTVDNERPEEVLSHEGKDVDCPNCAAPLEKPRDRDVMTLVCSYCGAQIDLSAAQANVMGVNSKNIRPDFLLEIGQAGTLAGQRYEVSGRLLYRDNWGFEGREYVLYNPERGYLWLAEENGHFVLSRPTTQAPKMVIFDLPPKFPVKVGEQEFRFYEESEVRIAYVDGALPWLAKVNDQFKAATLVAPPKQFGIESDSGEVSHFIGDYMAPEEIWKAFGLKSEVWETKGVHGAQPYIESPTSRSLMWLGLIFAALNFLLLAWSSVADSQQVHHSKLSPAEYTQEHLSPPFNLAGGGVMRMKVAAPVKNTWASVDVALVDEKEQVVAESGADVSYYEGTEGGEHWTEGSQEDEVFFQSPGQGRYRLMIKGASGDQQGAQPGSGISGGPPITVDLYHGAILSRYFLMTFGAALLLPLFVIMRRRIFEQKRWDPVTHDDGDETDWDDLP